MRAAAPLPTDFAEKAITTQNYLVLPEQPWLDGFAVRVVAIVAEGSLAQDTSIKTKTETAKPSMIALFIT